MENNEFVLKANKVNFFAKKHYWAVAIGYLS